MWSQETWNGLAMLAIVLMVLILVVWGVGLRLVRQDDEKLRQKVLRSTWPQELETARYGDAYKGPREERGAQRKILGGFR